MSNITAYLEEIELALVSSPVVAEYHIIRSWANAGAGCIASVSRDTGDAASGTAPARIDVTATSGIDWHVEFAQYERFL